MITEEQWNKVDWTQANKAIAFNLGCTPSNVSQQRRKRGIQKAVNPLNEKLKDPSITWASLGNQEIAEQIGVSARMVADFRYNHHLPKAPVHRAILRERYLKTLEDDWDDDQY